MIRIVVCGLIVLGAFAARTAEGQVVRRVRFPTPGLPGYETHVFAYSNENYFPGIYSLRGFDADFTGPMNQVNPSGLPSIFQDANPLFPSVGAHPVQDSQFLFHSDDVLSIGVKESDGLLAGTVVGIAGLDLANPIPFAQIVTDKPSEVIFDFVLDQGAAIDESWRGPLSVCFQPEVFDVSMSVERVSTNGSTGLSTYEVTLDVFSNQSGWGIFRGVDIYAEFSGSLAQSGEEPTPLRSDLPESQRVGDSHFLADREGLLIPYEVETAGTLAAAFQAPMGDDLETQIPLAQIVTDDPSLIEIDLFVGGCQEHFVFRGFLVPEPSAAGLLVAAIAWRLVSGRLRSTRSGEPS